MIELRDFLQNVEEIAAERPAYKLGEDGSDGECDCIGLVIGAIRRGGGEWDGIHGTNYTVRNAVDYLTDIDGELTSGELVFKSRAPGESGYDLPVRYMTGNDKRDYYHVGVVANADPLRIVHCTSPGGIKEDTKIGQWKHRAWCSRVEQEPKEVYMPQQMIVTAPSGRTVNMREKPSLDAPLARKIDIGEPVTVTGETGEWTAVTYGNYKGYIKREFLTAPAEESAPDILTALYAAREAIENAIRAAGGA